MNNIPTVPQRRTCRPGRGKVRHLTAAAAASHAAGCEWKARGPSRGTPVVYLCATCSELLGQSVYHFGHDTPLELQR
jgi:hypothetical protein